MDSIFGLLEDDDTRDYILSMDGQELSEAAIFCNNYPSIEVEHEIAEENINQYVANFSFIESAIIYKPFRVIYKIL